MFSLFKKQSLSKNILMISVLCAAATVVLVALDTASAATNINQQINYQGKLTDTAGVAVADGGYDMEFKLYTVDSGGSAVWTETLTTTDQVQVANGLFSVMLGSTTALSGVDFNQTLYLGVNVSSDGEMVPRKILGAVPAAFEAKNAQTLDNIATTSFLRSDESDTISATDNTNALLTITQNGTGDILNLFDGGTEVFTVNGTGQVGIGTTTPQVEFVVDGDMHLTGGFYDNGNTRGAAGQILQTDGSGANWVATSTLNIDLADTSGILADGRFAVTGDWTGTFDGQEGSYYLDLANSTGDTDDITEGATNLYSQWVTTGSDVYYNTGSVGIGTSTPGANLAIQGTAGQTNNLFTLSSSTGASLLTVGANGQIVASSTATSTFANGINIESGCFAVNGTCVGGGASTLASLTDTDTTGAASGTLLIYDGANWVDAATSTLNINLADTSGILADGRFAVTGDWTGTFDGQEGSYYLDADNLTNLDASDLALTNGYVFRGGAGNTAEATSSLFIADSGYVGIGTTNPTAEFEVVGDIISKGTKWSTSSAAEASTWSSVTYGNGLFVAVANGGTNRVMTSPDGVNWATSSAAEASTWRSVTYGNGLFVAVAESGTNQVMTSPDGINWTARAEAEANQWRAVTYGNGLFVAVSANGTNRVMTSPDGINWATSTAAEANQWRAVTYGNGLFVAASADGTNRVMTSPDGITWTSRAATEASGWFGITYGNGLFVAVAESGTNQVMTSPDGITWTARTASEASQWYGVIYGSGIFVAVSSDGVMTSPDGITWTGRDEAETNDWESVTYGNGLFVAVTYGGTNQVMISGSPDISAFAHNNIYQGGMTLFGGLGLGSSTPQGLLTLDKSGISGSSVNGIKEYFNITNSVEDAVIYGDNAYIVNAPSATTTLVGKMVRLEDSTTLGNTVRGLEVQTHRGTNTQGENTALSGIARTFGVRGITEGDAGGVFAPAGLFGQTRGTTQGNALRAYSSSITTGDLVSLFHDTSDFVGTGLVMNFGNSGGTYAASSTFMDLQIAGVSKFTISAHGSTTIGDGTTNNSAGIQIGYGGLCVDNDGTCHASTTGLITSVTSATANSDLAEMYFSSDILQTGEIVYTTGGLSVGRAGDENEQNIIGVVSTKPGLLLGFDDTSLVADEKAYPIGLAGRVPIRLSTEAGDIVAGDHIALSSIPGIGMKASAGDRVVGVALEDFDGIDAYSEGFINQFGDDMVDPVFEPVSEPEDERIHDGCYFGGGADLDSEECIAVDTSEFGTDPYLEINAQLAQDAKDDALRALADTQAEVAVTPSGEEVSVGQVIMFIDLGWGQLAEGVEAEFFAELFATTLANLETEETVWDRLKDLGQRFVDGVLTVLRINAVEVYTEKLCVDSVCVTGEDLRALLEVANQSGTYVQVDGEVVVVPDEDDEDDGNGDPVDGEGETATSTDEVTEEDETATTTDPVEEGNNETATSTEEQADAPAEEEDVVIEEGETEAVEESPVEEDITPPSDPVVEESTEEETVEEEGESNVPEEDPIV